MTPLAWIYVLGPPALLLVFLAWTDRLRENKRL